MKATLLALLLWLERPTQFCAFSGNSIWPYVMWLLTRECFDRILHTALEDNATFWYLHAAATPAAINAKGRRLRGLGPRGKFARREDDVYVAVDSPTRLGLEQVP